MMHKTEKDLASVMINDSNPEKAVKSVITSRIKELKRELGGDTKTVDGRKVLEEHPMPKHLTKVYEGMCAQSDVTKQAMTKMKHMQEGFWAQVREHFDFYNHNLHVDDERMVIQITSDDTEDEDEE